MAKKRTKPLMEQERSKAKQEQIVATAKGKQTSPIKHVTISITEEQHKRLKMHAIEMDMTVSGLVQQWIDSTMR